MIRTGSSRAVNGAAAVVAALVGVLAGGGPASGQEEPVVINPAQELEPIGIGGIDLSLEIDWRHNEDTVDPANAPKRRDAEDRLREFLNIATDLYVGHPNLLEINFAGRFGLQQRWLDLDTSPSSGRLDDTLINFDVRGTFFQKQPLVLTLGALRTDNTINRQFGGSLDNEIWQYGARLQFKNPTIPTNAEIFRREEQQFDRGLNDFFRIEQDTLQLDGRIEFSQNSRAWWDYSVDDISQEGNIRVTRDILRHEANGFHTIDFGRDFREQLRSQIRWYQETGDLDFSQFLIAERLRLVHAENLSSRYDVQFDRFEREGLEQRGLDLNAQVRHQLFDSLSTIGDVGARFFEIPTDDFTSDSLFGRISLEYDKIVPRGRLLVGADLGAARTDESDRGVPIPVINEPCPFDLSDICTVGGRNILEDSVRVTNLAGTLEFTEGVDYTLLVLPDRAEIRRIPGGAIPPGDTVLVDYALGPEPGGVIDTVDWGARARYRFSEGYLQGLSLYTQYRDQSQNRNPEQTDPAFIANEFNDLIYGVDYGRGPIFLLAEQQHRDSTLSPFDKLRLEGRFILALGPAGSVTLTGFFQDIDRRDVAATTSTTTFSAQWRARLTRRLAWTFRLLWRDENDTFAGDTRAFEQELRLNWQYQQTFFFTELRNSMINSDVNDRTSLTVFMGVRREF